MRPSTALEGFFLSKYSVSCLQIEMGCCPWWLPLAPAEQSIQSLICHTSRLRLCYCEPQDSFYNESLFISIYSGNQSKSQEKMWVNLNCLSLFTSHVVSTSHINRWRLCHCSPQDNQSKSWKKCDLCLFCHWSLLMPLAPARQSIQLLICHINRRILCHRSP